MAALHLCSPDSHRQGSWSARDLRVRGAHGRFPRAPPSLQGHVFNCSPHPQQPRSQSTSRKENVARSWSLCVGPQSNQQAGVALSWLDAADF